MFRVAFVLFASIVAVAFAGCEPSGVETVRVKGQVAYDGTAVPEGDIVFIPPDPAVPSVAARIQAGQYVADVPPGEKKIEIRATRIVPGKMSEDNPGSSEPATEMYIPAKYNVDTTLAESIPAEGGQIDFDLPK